MNPSDTIPVETLVVMPRTKSRVGYTVNGTGDMHSQRNQEMIDFLCLHLPTKTTQIQELIWTFQSFFVILETQEIYVLEIKKTMETQVERIRRAMKKDRKLMDKGQYKSPEERKASSDPILEAAKSLYEREKLQFIRKNSPESMQVSSQVKASRVY